MKISWEEVKGLTALAKISSVEEMIPKPAVSTSLKIGEEQYRIIEACLRVDSTIEDACMAAWISVAAYYKHIAKNPEFARRVDLARQFPKMAARAAVQKRILQWDAKTALRFLELRDKRYRPEAEDEVNEDNKTRVEFTLVSTIEWADQLENDSQTSTKQSSPYDTSVSSWEKQTPWENEEEALRRLAS